MSKQVKISYLAVWLVLFIYGCSAKIPISQNWGKSFGTAKLNQIWNRDASENLSPVEGLNGKVAEAIIEKSVIRKNTKQSESPELGALMFKK